jgi:sarcosine oxidase, subunit alpha
MPFRTRATQAPVHIDLDGTALEAATGEPVAAALVAAGRLAIARSPKFHRPRGPSCMRGGCDGCLARVDGAPNVMTCMVAARDGMMIESQNTLGSRDHDLLRVTDWFFPKGINPHELLAGVFGAQRVMQAFARRLAGLGRLPASETAPRRANRRRADVVVVGSGPSGMTVAAILAEHGRTVEVIDDALRPGGGLRALGATDRSLWAEVDERFDAGGTSQRIQVRTSTVVGGFFGDDLLLVGAGGAEVVTANDVVFATGAHDSATLFEGNDLPGVMSARAAGLLLAEGVVVGRRVVVARGPHDEKASSAFAESFERATVGLAEVLWASDVVRVRGGRSVRAVVVKDGGREREIVADALLTDAPRAPAYELCLQAGARVEHVPQGFVVRADDGRIRDHVWAVGEVAGTPFEPQAILEEGARVAQAILRG